MEEKEKKVSIFKVLNLIQPVCTLIILIFAVVAMINFADKFDNFGTKLKTMFTLDSAKDHDMLLNNNGLLGFTAADFGPVLIEKEKELTKLIVYEVELSEESKLTQTGLFGWGAFSKNQTIKYKGVASYSVDLDKLSTNDIFVDNEMKRIVISIEPVQLEPININEENIEIGETVNGLFTSGDIKLSLDEAYQLQNAVRQKMITKLNDENEIEKAKKAAKKAVSNIFQTFVNSVNSEYVIEVVFK